MQKMEIIHGIVEQRNYACYQCWTKTQIKKNKKNKKINKNK